MTNPSKDALREKIWGNGSAFISKINFERHTYDESESIMQMFSCTLALVYRGKVFPWDTLDDRSKVIYIFCVISIIGRCWDMVIELWFLWVCSTRDFKGISTHSLGKEICTNRWYIFSSIPNSYIWAFTIECFWALWHNDNYSNKNKL